jgi:hypothetical protein
VEVKLFAFAVKRVVADPELQATVRRVAIPAWCIAKTQRLAWATRAFSVTAPPLQPRRPGVTTNDFTAGLSAGFAFVTAAVAADGNIHEAAAIATASTDASQDVVMSRLPQATVIAAEGRFIGCLPFRVEGRPWGDSHHQTAT